MVLPSNIKLDNMPCPLGCEENDDLVLKSHDYLHGFLGEFSLVKCGVCGLMRTNPRPSPETIEYYYPDDYGPFLSTVVSKDKVSRVKTYLKQFIDLKSQALPPLKPGRLLEIGCASGAFLQAMFEKGWEVQGIESSNNAAKEGRKLGHKVHAGFLEDAPNPDKPFDLIVGWMVLEHLHEPVVCLKKLREWSTQNTYLALSIPNTNSMDFKIFKTRWYALQLPTHLYHFNPKTLEKVLLASGWKLEKIHHQRVLTNYLMSACYKLQDAGHHKLKEKILGVRRWIHFLYPLAWLLSLVGQTGRMTVWATPTNNQKEEK